MFAVGSQIGKYTLRRKLGQGGFGVVFAAYDESLDREVALKILNVEHKADADVMRRFLQEARAAARINHPGITTVHECVMMPDGVAYIAMELLDGESLAHRLHRSGRMSPAGAMEITRQIASALDAAHATGIVHRDLKPDNIFLVRDPAALHGERVKILDFGIAKLHHVQSGVHTSTNEVFGTPRYMSPEQCRSSTQIDQRSDIYTLGCILFELLTGRPPFVGQTGELFAQHLMVEAPSVLQFVKETPYHVADLVKRMLAKDVEARPASMAAVQHELAHGGAVVVGAVPATLPPNVPSELQPPPPPADTDATLKAAAGVSMLHETSRTPRAVFAAAAGIAILLAVALVLWLRGSGDDSKPAQVAASAPPPTTVTMPVVEEPKPAIEEPKPVPAIEQPKPVPAIEQPKPEPVAAKPEKKRSSKKADKTEKPAEKAPEPVVAEVFPKPQPVDPKLKTVNPFEAGKLVLKSTPACEILVDGKAIAQSTPQELKLEPGKHRITLINDELDIKESFTVVIKAGETERVQRDLSDKVKAKKRNATINPFGGSN